MRFNTVLFVFCAPHDNMLFKHRSIYRNYCGLKCVVCVRVCVCVYVKERERTIVSWQFLKLLSHKFTLFSMIFNILSHSSLESDQYRVLYVQLYYIYIIFMLTLIDKMSNYRFKFDMTCLKIVLYCIIKLYPRTISGKLVQNSHKHH